LYLFTKRFLMKTIGLILSLWLLSHSLSAQFYGDVSFHYTFSGDKYFNTRPGVSFQLSYFFNDKWGTGARYLHVWGYAEEYPAPDIDTVSDVPTYVYVKSLQYQRRAPGWDVKYRLPHKKYGDITLFSGLTFNIFGQKLQEVYVDPATGEKTEKTRFRDKLIFPPWYYVGFFAGGDYQLPLNEFLYFTTSVTLEFLSVPNLGATQMGCVIIPYFDFKPMVGLSAGIRLDPYQLFTTPDLFRRKKPHSKKVNPFFGRSAK